MRTQFLLLVIFLTSSGSFAQITITNNTYVYVNGSGFTSGPNVAPLYVTEDVRIEDTSTIYLRNDAQLLQGNETPNNSGTGSLSVYQEGTVHNYAYNYWASPVGNRTTDVVGNSPFIYDVDILNDVTDITNSTPAALIGGLNGTSSPLGIAKYWLWSYVAGDVYADWNFLGNGDHLNAGLGFTMKGSTGSTSQQYDFKGKPNSGTMNTAVLNGSYTLVGNPYPSALDALEYINDPTNVGVMTGTLFFWEQNLGISSHVLTQYVGGYATYTINAAATMESFVPAVFTTLGDDGFPNSTGSTSTNGKSLRRYIPVGQGFMIEGAANGNVQVKNSHRVFYKESDTNSEFFKSSSKSGLTNQNNYAEFEYDENGLQILPNITGLKRFRLNVDFNDEHTRQLLHNFTPDATDGFDYGLESNNLEPNTKDAYFILGNMPYITQAHNFDINLKIPLVINIDANSAIRVRIFDVQNFDGQSIYIHDKVTNVYYDLTNQNFDINIPTGNYTDRFEVTFTNNETLSTTEFEDSNFTVFQNNTLSQLVVANPEALNIKSVTLIDIAGKQIFKKIDLDNSTRYEFPTKNLSDGVYITTIKLDNNSIISKKIIITNK